MNVNVDLNLILTEQTNGGPPLNPMQALQIRNNGDALERITLQIASSSRALMPGVLELDRIEAGELVEIPLTERICLNEEYLQHLCHALTTEVVITVAQAGEEIASMAWQVTIRGVNNDEK